MGFKGQSHFLLLKNIGLKTSKAKRSCLKIRRVPPLNQLVKGLISQALKQAVNGIKMCKKRMQI
jgi:hypothetical protein